MSSKDPIVRDAVELKADVRADRVGGAPDHPGLSNAAWRTTAEVASSAGVASARNQISTLGNLLNPEMN
jgi:hypothetical protein